MLPTSYEGGGIGRVCGSCVDKMEEIGWVDDVRAFLRQKEKEDGLVDEMVKKFMRMTPKKNKNKKKEQKGKEEVEGGRDVKLVLEIKGKEKKRKENKDGRGDEENERAARREEFVGRMMVRSKETMPSSSSATNMEREFEEQSQEDNGTKNEAVYGYDNGLNNRGMVRKAQKRQYPSPLILRIVVHNVSGINSKQKKVDGEEQVGRKNKEKEQYGNSKEGKQRTQREERERERKRGRTEIKKRRRKEREKR